MIDRAPLVRILGTHGVPAAYGGFETAAENVGLYLRDRGWDVHVYCQVPGQGAVTTDTWQGLTRVRVPEHRPGWIGTSSFDWKCIRHGLAHRQPGEVWLTFGYNTGLYNVLPKLRDVPNVINMDGMEWTRARWGPMKQGILLGNERFAGAVGTYLVADHPEIAGYLRRHFGSRRVVTITYGADAVTEAPTEPVTQLGLTPGHYANVICRPIPENSLLEIVRAWSSRERGLPLVVLGTFEDDDPYHRAVREAASGEVLFPGAIYEPERVRALRFHSSLYLHGHTVGGTNPSLVEAMAAGNPVVAQNNVYNTWVAGPDQRYFDDDSDLAGVLDAVLADEAGRRRMGAASRARHAEEFTWEHIGSQYEQALVRARGRHPSRLRRAVRTVGARVRPPRDRRANPR